MWVMDSLDNNDFFYIEKIKESILESSEIGTLVLGCDMKILYSNEEFVRLLNLPIHISSKTNVYEIMEYLKTQIKGPDVFLNADYCLRHSKGKYCFYLALYCGRSIEVCSYPMYDGKIFKGTIYNLKDVTERRKVSQLEEQLMIKQQQLERSHEYEDIKNQFLNTISHEFKTPLTVILGAVQLLMSKHNQEAECPLYRNAKKSFTIIRRNCYRMIKLTNNLIDLTKIESGYLNMDIRNQDIVSIIEDVTLSVADYAKRKGISIIFDTNIEEKVIGCDAGLLERVMLNLLSNAIKFTDYHGRINVDLIDKGDLIVIKVKDNGIGIPQEKIDIIFDRFGLVDSSLNRQHEGSGVGLAIVKSLVEKHEGRIYLNSGVDIGSEFIIELPTTLAENVDFKVNLTRNTTTENIHIEFSDIYELNL